ncbi:PREDICTED: cytochrome b5 isoform X1 [Wasmannia auropunctata]|uniref:cytochrome b5 isoform X1 n=2 Tax=Wasmannia auropunctata TaxID=64793 RepID=UPI0005EE86B4|nr:PREDICTED: cytochrome b5 isoform X1 [Wasmannia auropunctata]
MSLDRHHQQKRCYRTFASETDSSMDFVNLTFRSLDLADVNPSREDFLQVERDSVAERNDTIREQRCRLKEKSRDELRTINLAEVAYHDTPGDCWLVIYDYVYDCTEFLKSHPGGEDVLLEYAGRDATLAFVGTGHSAVARATLERYKIGELPPEERIFRTPNGLKVSEF